MIQGCAIVLFTFFLIENVCSNTCGHVNCENAIDVPLITKLNAPMKVELDISSLTTQLKELIVREVEKAVSKATNSLVENVMDKRFQTAVDRLKSSNSVAMSTFRKEIEAELKVKMEKNFENSMKKQNISATEIHDSLTIMGNNLIRQLEQLKSEVKATTERVSITACARDTITYHDNQIIKFSDVKLSNGISNVNNFKSSGIFTCEKQGTYLIGVYIMSSSSYAKFRIIKNGIMVSRVHVNPFLRERSTPTIVVDPDPYHTGTGIIGVQLNAFDTIEIKAGYKTPVYGHGYSCFTVIKVK